MAERRPRPVTNYRAEELVPLTVVAEELHVSLQRLKDLAKRDEFPELLRVTSRHYLMRAKDFAQWKAWRSPSLGDGRPPEVFEREVPNDIRQQVIERDGTHCVYCGLAADPICNRTRHPEERRGRARSAQPDGFVPLVQTRARAIGRSVSS